MRSALPGMEYVPMTITIALWSGTYIAGKFAVTDLTPSSLLLLRYLAASAIMIPVMMLFEPGRWRVGMKDSLPLFAIGLTGMFGNNIFFFLALKYTSVMNASIIFAITPFLTALLAAMFAGEPLEMKRLGAIALALFGVVLLLTGGDISVLTTMEFNKGDLYEVLAALCAASYTVIAKKVAFRYTPLVVTGYGMIFAALLALPLAATEMTYSTFSAITSRGWASLVYLAVLASCVAYLLQQVSVKKIGANRTAAFINLSPAMTIALAALFLGERISMIQAISVGIIVAGVALNAAIKPRPEAI